METLVWLLVFFIVLNTAVKMSLWKMWQQIACCLVIGLLVFGATHYVVLLSKTQLEAMVQQTAVLRDVAVVLTVDAAVCTAFCLLWLNEEQPRSRMGRCMWALLYAYPQLLVLPASCTCCCRGVSLPWDWWPRRPRAWSTASPRHRSAGRPCSPHSPASFCSWGWDSWPTD